MVRGVCDRWGIDGEIKRGEHVARTVSPREAYGQRERGRESQGAQPPQAKTAPPGAPPWEAGTEDTCLVWRLQVAGRSQAGGSHGLPLGCWADECKVLSGRSEPLVRYKGGV